MRSFAPAVLACLTFAAAVGGWLIAASARGGSTSSSTANTPAPAGAENPAASAATAPIDNIAPARHARRRACLKVAKQKRLVGAQRTAYVKSCMGSL